MKNKGVKQKGRKRGSEQPFGCDLTEHLQSSGHDVPQVLKTCAEFIEEHGVVDGIYRLSGITSNIQRLRQEFCGDGPDLTKAVYLQDIHCVGSLCKLYFRELPDPLLTYQLYHRFTEAVSLSGPDQRLNQIQEVIKELPAAHFRTLEYLANHLARLANLSPQTNMHHRNLALVWAPNLLRSKDIEASSCNGDLAFQEVRVQQAVVEFILNNTEQIFNHSATHSKSRDTKEGLGLGCGEKYATLPLSSQGTTMKLMSLEEAQARSLGPDHPAHRTRHRENSLPDASTAAFYHTDIQLSDSKRKSSDKSKKWRSIFSLGKEAKGKLSRNGSVFIRGMNMTGKPVVRPARSMDSLCSLPTDEDRGGVSLANGRSGPDGRSRTLEADALYDLCDQEPGAKGKVVTATEGGSSPGRKQRFPGSAAVPLKALPEQLKVFKGDVSSGLQPASPKSRRTLYSSHSAASRPSFPGSLFPLESPRHQRKTLTISEPFAVSVPLRVSAVINSNSTPCRTLERQTSTTVSTCRSEQSSSGSSACEGGNISCSNSLFLLDGEESRDVKDDGPPRGAREVAVTQLEKTLRVTEGAVAATDHQLELWTDLNQELKITEPEEQDPDSSCLTSQPPYGPQASSANHQPPYGPQASSANHQPPYGPQASSANHQPPSGPQTSSANHQPPSGPQASSANHQPPYGPQTSSANHQPPYGPQASSANHQPPYGPQTLLSSRHPTDTGKNSATTQVLFSFDKSFDFMFHTDTENLNTKPENKTSNVSPKDEPCCQDEAEDAKSFPAHPDAQSPQRPASLAEDTQPASEDWDSMVNSKAVSVSAGHLGDSEDSSVCSEIKANILELSIPDDEDNSGGISEELDLVEPWDDFSSTKQWVTSPLHSPAIEELFSKLPPPCSAPETLQLTEETLLSVCKSLNPHKAVDDLSTSRNTEAAPGDRTQPKGSCLQPAAVKPVLSADAASPCGTTRHKSAPPSQRCHRQVSQEATPTERPEGKHRPFSLNLDSGYRCIRDISNQQNSNFSEFSSNRRGSVTPSGTAQPTSLPLDLELFLTDRQAPARRNSAPVSVSSVRTAFMIKTCQATAVPVIPPKVQYSQIPPSRHDRDGSKGQEKEYLKSPREKTDLMPPLQTITDLKEELENKEPAPRCQRQPVVDLPKTTPTPELPVTRRRNPSNADRSSLLQRPSFRNRQRPQSLILFSPPFPIMDHPPSGEDGKLPLSHVRSLTDAPSEVAESFRGPEGITLPSKMTIPKSGQRLETSTSCFYQPQRRSMILESRSPRQID